MFTIANEIAEQLDRAINNVATLITETEEIEARMYLGEILYKLTDVESSFQAARWNTNIDTIEPDSKNNLETGE